MTPRRRSAKRSDAAIHAVMDCRASLEMTPHLSCRTRSGIQCHATHGLRIRSAMTSPKLAMTVPARDDEGTLAMTSRMQLCDPAMQH